MANYESTNTPLNGRELKEILKINTERNIEKIPLLKEGAAFHKANLVYAATLTCYPTDTPVPEIEFSVDIESKPTPENINELEFHFKSIEKLEDRYSAVEKFRDLSQELLEKLGAALDKARPQVEFGDEIDGTTPDKPRIAHGIAVPVMGTINGKRIEMKIDPKKLTVKNPK